VLPRLARLDLRGRFVAKAKGWKKEMEGTRRKKKKEKGKWGGSVM